MLISVALQNAFDLSVVTLGNNLNI